MLHKCQWRIYTFWWVSYVSHSLQWQRQNWGQSILSFSEFLQVHFRSHLDLNNLSFEQVLHVLLEALNSNCRTFHSPSNNVAVEISKAISNIGLNENKDFMGLKRAFIFWYSRCHWFWKFFYKFRLIIFFAAMMWSWSCWFIWFNWTSFIAFRCLYCCYCCWWWFWCYWWGRWCYYTWFYWITFD